MGEQGLFVSPSELDDAVFVYDPSASWVHVISPLAALVLVEPDATDDELIAMHGETSQEQRAELASQLQATRHDLAAAGLVCVAPFGARRGRRPCSLASGDDMGRGLSHPILRRCVAFRSTDAELLKRVDEFMASSAEHRVIDSSTIDWIDLTAHPDGGVLLRAADEWAFPTMANFWEQLPGVIHDHVAHSVDDVVLHAGAVRTADGSVAVVAGASGSGKSTMIAALVREGAGYLGDEMTGVEVDSLNAVACPTPLTLDDNSCRYLTLDQRGDVGVSPTSLNVDVDIWTGVVAPVSVVLLPVYRPGAEVSVTRLSVLDALKALLANAVNLGRVGEDGFAALCQLAERVPVISVEHPDALAVARALCAGDLDLGAPVSTIY